MRIVPPDQNGSMVTKAQEIMAESDEKKNPRTDARMVREGQESIGEREIFQPAYLPDDQDNYIRKIDFRFDLINNQSGLFQFFKGGIDK